MTTARHVDRARVSRLNEAADWLLRMANPARTEAETNEWLRWLENDSENLAAYEAIQGDWDDLDALKQAPERVEAKPPGRRHFRTMRFALAAGVVLAVAAGLTFRNRPESPPRQVEATEINRAATLPDGSKVILAARTRLSVEFSREQRALVLPAGEAYFKVRHDTRHPFSVRAGDLDVVAVGTAFDVRRGSDNTTITVEEGTVQVSLSGSETTWRAIAGEQLTYSTAQRTATIVNVDPSIALQWRNGELAYVREPLGAVIDDLNRYSPRKIRVEDPQLSDLPFTGTAFTTNVDDWLKAVQQAYRIEVQNAAGGDIVLGRRPE